VTESDIYHFAAQAKMASISREFSGECFDFDRLSASCLGGLVLERRQKEAISRLLEGKDVLSVLPTGFGKSLIYQSFVLATEIAESSFGCSYFRLKLCHKDGRHLNNWNSLRALPLFLESEKSSSVPHSFDAT